jgi:hypothetical protein
MLSGSLLQANADDGSPAKPPFQRRGFYLHGAWKYNYPFAVRSWKPADYHNMFQLLKQLGFNTVMLWPGVEAIPMPISRVDREALQTFRPIIGDARKCGLETWLTTCPNVVSNPEIAAKPWMERSLYAHMKTIRLDDPKEAEAYLEHRSALMAILNNADGYVTIDGDPGGYPNAKPADFLKIFLSDRKTIDQFGTHAKTQKVIPWIWCGWGANGVWKEPIEPFVTATLEAIKQQNMPEPWELLPGRSYRKGWANGRTNMELVKTAGLLDRSTLMLYEIIEFEPSQPAPILQFADIRRVMKQELEQSPGVRGFFGNAQQPIMVLPNTYFFARCAMDPSYIHRTDNEVLTDFAQFLGGPPELLIPAWSSLYWELDKLPVDLPRRLRSAKLSGPAASFLPGGATSYLNLLASHVDSRIRLLQACQWPGATPEATASAIADATSALIDWWKLHRYVGSGEGHEAFQWNWAHPTQYGLLKNWCARNAIDSRRVSELAAREIVKRGLFTEKDATDRVRELLSP